MRNIEIIGTIFMWFLHSIFTLICQNGNRIADLSTAISWVFELLKPKISLIDHT